MPDLFKFNKALLTALAVLLAPTLVYGQVQSGTLDLSFGTGGRVTTDFGGSEDVAAAVAVQADGKLVAAGGATIEGQSDFAVARYDSSGRLDLSFGTLGTVTTDLGSPFEAATSLAVQSDGKIVVAGSTVINPFSDFALVRYDSDGTLDTTFGTGGKVTTDFGVSAQAHSVAVQSDGRIVVAGLANVDGGDDFALVRYNSDGTLDGSFGTRGKVTTDFGLLEQGFSVAQAFSLAVQADGRIVVAGRAFIGEGFDFALARYDSEGMLDASFGTGGRVTTDFGGSGDGVLSVAVEPDGKIVVAGQANIVGGRGFALARYDSTGALDSSFGTGGKVTTDFGLLTQGFSSAAAFSLAAKPDGKVVAGGRAFLNGGFHSALAQYNSNGSLDASFGAGGRVTTNSRPGILSCIDFENSNDVSAIAVQPDGKTVTAGAASVGGSRDFALARYN